jgi:succinate dehydrogenase/fumarate reductase cytochrome b subunit
MRLSNPDVSKPFIIVMALIFIPFLFYHGIDGLRIGHVKIPLRGSNEIVYLRDSPLYFYFSVTLYFIFGTIISYAAIIAARSKS